jgi:hypothetical protein
MAPPPKKTLFKTSEEEIYLAKNNSKPTACAARQYEKETGHFA